MKSFKYLFLFSILLIFSQCSTNNTLQNDYVQPNAIILGDSNNFISFKFDSYRLNNLKIENDSLIISLSYGGGCQDHVFNLIAKNYFIDGDKTTAELLLSHDSNQDICEAFVTEKLAFNLIPLKLEYIDSYGSESGTIRLLLEDKEVLYRF